MCVFRVQENDDGCKPPGDVPTGTYGNFSETQTESQVITLTLERRLSSLGNNSQVSKSRF